MNIGLMMVKEENDILAWSLRRNIGKIDALYVLDGTEGRGRMTRKICEAFAVSRYLRDEDLGGPVTDGSRQALYEAAVEDHGYDHWFLLLHADEVWECRPEEAIALHPDCDGFGFRLPFYVPLSVWNPEKGPEQLEHRMEPGWPEFRLFRGNPDIGFHPEQMSNCQPNGMTKVAWTPLVIRHYPFRSAASQWARAEASFSKSNYRLAGPVWTLGDVERAKCEHHQRLVRVP